MPPTWKKKFPDFSLTFPWHFSKFPWHFLNNWLIFFYLYNCLFLYPYQFARWTKRQSIFWLEIYKALTLLMLGHYLGWWFSCLYLLLPCLKYPATVTWRGAKSRKTAGGVASSCKSADFLYPYASCFLTLVYWRVIYKIFMPFAFCHPCGYLRLAFPCY